MSETQQAVVVAVGEAVKARIAAASLSERQFTLSRNYATWDIELKNIDGLQLQESEKLRVDVVTHTLAQSIDHIGRNAVKFGVPVDIAIRKKFSPSAMDQETGDLKVDAIDALMLLQQEIVLLFCGQLLAGDESIPAAWDQEAGGTEIVFGPLKQHLREMNQFTGLIRVHFRAQLPIIPRAT